jgi:hypothetical protein
MLEKFASATKINENDIFSEEIAKNDNIADDILTVISDLKFEENENINIKSPIIAFDNISVVLCVD